MRPFFQFGSPVYTECFSSAIFYVLFTFFFFFLREGVDPFSHFSLQVLRTWAREAGPYAAKRGGEQAKLVSLPFSQVSLSVRLPFQSGLPFSHASLSVRFAFQSGLPFSQASLSVRFAFQSGLPFSQVCLQVLRTWVPAKRARLPKVSR